MALYAFAKVQLLRSLTGRALASPQRLSVQASINAARRQQIHSAPMQHAVWLDCDPGVLCHVVRTLVHTMMSHPLVPSGPGMTVHIPCHQTVSITFSGSTNGPFAMVRVTAGHDDALAIMLAATHPSLNLIGVSTVACNQTVEKCTANALAVLHAIRCTAPVYQGQARPLMRQTLPCAEIHGNSGAQHTHLQTTCCEPSALASLLSACPCAPCRQHQPACTHAQPPMCMPAHSSCRPGRPRRGPPVSGCPYGSRGRPARQPRESCARHRRRHPGAQHR
jgi:Inosine-uridine preferring nucleoside hydrolase